MPNTRTTRRIASHSKVETAATLDDIQRQIRAAGVLLANAMTIMQHIHAEAGRTRSVVVDHWPGT